MQVEVISSVNEACSGKLQHRTAIVVDVLRATTTIATALAAGASCVIPAETVQDAKQLTKEGDLAGGDRFCRQISGFSYGNSPGKYRGKQIEGKRIVLTTSNGTRALCKAMKADHIIAASLLNAEACALLALELRRDIVILCAGSRDSFALEDGLCAGLLVHCLRQHDRSGTLRVDDFGSAMEALYLNKANAIMETLAQSQTGKKLLRLGHREDIANCSHVNVLQVVPYLNGGSLIQRSPGTLAQTAVPFC
jgi:2-phosphosulfolactate phosphatase